MAIGRVARLAAGALLLVLTVPRIGWADGMRPDKMACIAADTDGQSLRITGNLLRARKRFAVCSATTCPGIVRDDCLQRVAELEAVQPTVVFTATNGVGRAVVAVRVSVDGDVVADRLDGRPIRVDPGDHVFVFEALGRLTTQMRLTLHEGDKDVRHAVVLHTSAGDPADEVPAPEPIAPVDGVTSDAELPAAAPSAVAPAPVQAVPPSTMPLKEEPLSKRRVAAIGVGAAGTVGVILGSIFGAITIKEWSDARFIVASRLRPRTACTSAIPAVTARVNPATTSRAPRSATGTSRPSRSPPAVSVSRSAPCSGSSPNLRAREAAWESCPPQVHRKDSSWCAGGSDEMVRYALPFVALAAIACNALVGAEELSFANRR